MKHLKKDRNFDFWTDVLAEQVRDNETDKRKRGLALGGLIFQYWNATEASLSHNFPEDDEIQTLEDHCLTIAFSTPNWRKSPFDRKKPSPF